LIQYTIKQSDNKQTELAAVINYYYKLTI